MKKENKFFIIGSAGLIGSEVCRILKKKIFKYVHSDKNLDISKKPFFMFLSKKKPNILINCSSHPGGLSFEDPFRNAEINYLANINIAKWCAENNCKFIFLSSSAVYGNRKKKIKIKENDISYPETVYGINKLATEKFIIEFSKFKNLDWLIMRLFATYGPGHKLNNYQGIVNVILNQALNKKKTIILKGSKKRTRSLIHVHDAARIIIKLALSDHRNKIFNVASKKFYAVGNIIKMVGKILNTKFKIKEIKKTHGDPMHNIANIEKLLKFVKFKFKFELNKGLEDTINKYKII